MVGRSFLQVWIEPFVQRCCCDLKPFMSTGKFGRGDHVREEDELPAGELRAITQIEIFGQRVVLPAARLLDADCPPEPGRAVEIEEAAAAAARRLFEQEMAIQEHRLHPREQGIAAVQMAPAGLDHPDFRIGEEMDRLAQQIRLRNEIGIEDTDEIALGGGEPGFQARRL